MCYNKTTISIFSAYDKFYAPEGGISPCLYLLATQLQWFVCLTCPNGLINRSTVQLSPGIVGSRLRKIVFSVRRGRKLAFSRQYLAIFLKLQDRDGATLLPSNESNHQQSETLPQARCPENIQQTYG